MVTMEPKFIDESHPEKGPLGIQRTIVLGCDISSTGVIALAICRKTMDISEIALPSVKKIPLEGRPSGGPGRVQQGKEVRSVKWPET